MNSPKIPMTSRVLEVESLSDQSWKETVEEGGEAGELPSLRSKDGDVFFRFSLGTICFSPKWVNFLTRLGEFWERGVMNDSDDQPSGELIL